MSLIDSLGRILRDAYRASQRRTTRSQRTAARERNAPPLSRTYPGDHTGAVTITYAPHAGTLPDPGEVVWTWVPYEEDHSRGKDRPVLIIGREADWLLGLPMSSVDHERDEAQEAEEGRYWVEVGTGPWDPRSRKPSTARVDRIVRVDPRKVRRIGGKLDKARFDKVARGVRRHLGR